jgi:hypothetical protein
MGPEKSTTMKNAYLFFFEPTAGSAEVLWLRHFKTAHACKKSKSDILPEHNPLYLDMYVKGISAFLFSGIL